MGIKLRIQYKKIVDVDILHEFTEEELKDFREHYNFNDEEWTDFLEDPTENEVLLYNYFSGYRSPDYIDEYWDGDYMDFDYIAIKEK